MCAYVLRLWAVPIFSRGWRLRGKALRNRRLSLFALGVLAYGILFPACARHRLTDDEIERNRLFAALIEREDRRTLGGDDFFRKNLEDSPYPQVREWCAVALGRIGLPRALPWLFGAFHSPYASVRAAAAFSVGKIEERDALRTENRAPDPRTVAALSELLADPSLQVQMRAVEALGRCGASPEANRIARRLDSFAYDHTPRGRAFLDAGMTALMRLKEPGTFPLLEKLAGSDDPEIQWRAVNALTRAGDRAACPTFLRMLQSENPEVRYYAARGLGICGDPGLSGRLLPLLPPFETGSGTPVPLPVRLAALQSLGTLKNPEAVSAIRAALAAAPVGGKDTDQSNFAIAATTALADIGSREAEPVLVSLLNIPGPVANAAAVALGKTLRAQPDRFFDIVRGISFAEPPAVRAWARALGELGGERAIAELKALLMKSANEPAGSAALLALPAVLDALARAGSSDLQQILLPYLESYDGVAVRAALAAYKPLPGAQAPWTPVLEAYARASPGTDVETKTALIDRLEPWIREPAVLAMLRAALRDRDRNARIAALRLLRMSGAPDLPDETGPAESRLTAGSYELIAAERRDRMTVILETTRGSIEFELFMEDAPLTADNFIRLAKGGFFDGLTFMRVVPHFVIQGGDPRNDQEGGPGYSIRCEINMHPFERGSVGMALAGKDTGGSQFFIATSPQPHLDGSYTCFGRVTSGMPAVEHMLPGDRILKVRIEEDVTAVDPRGY